MRPFYASGNNADLFEIGFVFEFFENSFIQVRPYIEQSGFTIAESDAKLVFGHYLDLCYLRSHFITSMVGF